MIKALTIAGFDGSGGAGIQADLKTFSALGVYGMCVLTALPVQNTQGVRNCYEIELKAVKEQLECIFDDIIPDAVKIGMLFNSDIIKLIYDFLNNNAKNIPIIVDPVMAAKSGDRLLLKDAVDSLKKYIIPISTIVTPNIPEAEDLTSKKINTDDDMIDAANDILNMGAKNVMIKGGHLKGELSRDLFMSKDNKEFLDALRIDTKNTHGTGCTLSAAICSYTAHGKSPFEASKLAKEYLFNALLAAKTESVGKGHGPVHHFYEAWKYLNI
ncbi:bifunctional hydroxymethylpyrimidine kinase/phosphomethylpyrimidine kinase [uncultured Brachyspira sp.]|uniref:bifunctional hydroxymethylpyrimidine kinase/phosphomethylpyrimidine kinase n=1 Tax=uncultured Brachyspira sp. TaxID=221953 RepID=UPI0025CCCE61|nr:bifunctional hydroxymethylpyrimidine kinase/phosphomethylpyrimidine kinase [uncultured Brachyspira sp.]